VAKDKHRQALNGLAKVEISSEKVTVKRLSNSHHVANK